MQFRSVPFQEIVPTLLAVVQAYLFIHSAIVLPVPQQRVLLAVQSLPRREEEPPVGGAGERGRTKGEGCMNITITVEICASIVVK